MNEKIRRKLEKVVRWIPSITRVCFSIVLIGAIMIYTHNDVEFATYFASVVSIMILCYMAEFIFIHDRLYKLEREKK